MGFKVSAFLAQESVVFPSSNLCYSCGQPKPTTFIVAKWLMEIVQFCRIIFSFAKGVDCAFFGIFSQLFRGVGQILRLKTRGIDDQRSGWYAPVRI